VGRSRNLKELAEAALRRKLESAPAIDVVRSIEEILSELPMEEIRAKRTITVLEYLNSPDALALLEALARGATAAWLTNFTVRVK
jgi:hypothetical protein